jgi:hypothetical protein
MAYPFVNFYQAFVHKTIEYVPNYKQMPLKAECVEGEYYCNFNLVFHFIGGIMKEACIHYCHRHECTIPECTFSEASGIVLRPKVQYYHIILYGTA